MALYLVLAAVALFIIFNGTTTSTASDHRRNAMTKYSAGGTTTIVDDARQYPAALKSTKSRYAFATFLASDAVRPDDQGNLHDDYFIATRILAYQVLHARQTRSKGIPFIVLTTKRVAEAKRERLRRDGAIVLTVESVDRPDWVKGGASKWEQVLDKLRLWEIVQFDRICFMDGDTVLNRPLDDVFLDPAAALHQTLNRSDQLQPDEAPLPPTYVFAGQPEMKHEHHYPPSEANHDYPNIHYLNAGFFVMAPSMEILNHYLSVLNIPNRFVPEFPEQNLLNYAHRSEAEGGNMPWRHLDPQWNLHYPSRADLEGGVASLHEKWWAPEDAELAPYLRSWRWRMEGFYEARDNLN